MFVAQLRKDGDEYVVTIPDDEVERRGWHGGQMVAVEATVVESDSDLSPDLREILNRNWEKNEPALRYLSER